jgi:hypothetical protein
MLWLCITHEQLQISGIHGVLAAVEKVFIPGGIIPLPDIEGVSLAEPTKEGVGYKSRLAPVSEEGRVCHDFAEAKGVERANVRTGYRAEARSELFRRFLIESED